MVTLPMNLVMKAANNTDPSSYAAKMRKKRFALFRGLLERVPKPVHILDIGGTQEFWEVMGFTEVPGVHVTLLNLEKPETRYDNFVGLAGNARDLSQFGDGQFDVVFSNSVIEHVGDYGEQQSMAREVRRVGKRYFVQTPNYFFPIEPHFLFPGFQWLPLQIRVFLVSRFRLGWIDQMHDLHAAKKLVESTRLLRKRELLALFPNAELYEEKLWGLTKSFVVYAGW